MGVTTMFDKSYIIEEINRDLFKMRNRRMMSNYCADNSADKQSFWDGYITALQIRDARVDTLNAFGYKPVYEYSEHGQKCIDIIPIPTKEA